jgi:hypothetical protein
VVHRAFASGLDFAALVAAGLGAVAAILVFVLARPRAQAGTPAASESPAAELGQTEPDPASTGA